ncbi:hypothetical protein ACEWY4_017036 [Coilia grayii]|uniref:Uncharacterized protein n=1 Tax=Coilia grayii TaxID=363190 RepID=A0ABD1JM42_9TELE
MEENEIPSSVFVKDPAPFPRELEENQPLDANRSTEEGLQTIHLSSDEELGGEEDEEESVGVLELQGENMERSRAEKLKRSSLKKVDSLKKAFSRQNIEKKMTKIGTKIVSVEQREKIKKSLTSTHTKGSPFKVSPLSFSIRKNRGSSGGGGGVVEGEVGVEGEGEPKAPGGVEEGEGGENSAPTAVASIELAPISPGEDLPFTELHPQLAPSPEAEEVKAAEEAMEKEAQPAGMGGGGAEEEEVEEVSAEYALSATLPQDASACNGTQGAGGEEEEEEEEEEEVEKEAAEAKDGEKEVVAEQGEAEEDREEVKGKGESGAVNDSPAEETAAAAEAMEAAAPVPEAVAVQQAS